MPIRFRCVYCDQLLGIAKRKAGTVVKCPNCAGQVIVPAPESADEASDPEVPTARAEDAAELQREAAQVKTAPAPVVAEAGEAGLLFERNDFDELLKPALERNEPAIAARTGRPVAKPQAAARAVAPAPAAPVAPMPVTVNTFDFMSAPPAPVPTVPPVAAVRPRSGILLTPIKLILLAFLVMIGMGLAFAGGGVLGWYLKK